MLCTLKGLVHAYNCACHIYAGFTFYFLMFRREAQLPVDIHLGIYRWGTQHYALQVRTAALRQPTMSLPISRGSICSSERQKEMAL
ncbi:hypothetical protein FKM82_019873 [Ascaphus truei]